VALQGSGDKLDKSVDMKSHLLFEDARRAEGDSNREGFILIFFKVIQRFN
jgi:hypothetical protein